MKFELDDPYAVYFHDTPARSLFAREYRFLSHGCMRLERPYDLAKRLLRNDPDWNEAKVDAALQAGVTRRAPMKRVMAYVFYWTAFVDDEGQMNFRPDAYGWDASLLPLIGGSGAPRCAATSRTEAAVHRARPANAPLAPTRGGPGVMIRAARVLVLERRCAILFDRGGRR